MRETLQFRNLTINSYMSILIVTLVGGAATLYIVHVANNVPLSLFTTAEAYTIDSSL
ncbi:MAG: hypothetical protein JWO84_568 [Parcubacteria group bacterium]|nr:hypothetical protein [Parcubacteria group bacterium]